MVQGQANKLLKADMHCHSLHSGRAKHLRFLRCRDCYSWPLDVYTFALNHFFHDFGDAARVREFTDCMAELFEVFEVRNGTQERDHNTLIANLVEAFRRHGRPVGVIGGSDSHTLRRLGRTYTACPAANRAEFLEAIRTGRSQVCGAHSNHVSLAADIYGVVLRYYPAVFSVGNGELPGAMRVRNILFSILAVPFLFVPYVTAARHSSIEHARVNQFARILSTQKSPLAATCEAE